jgi:ppGpp synthetase/RelA/SpoT-type nucleotidyltranferase
MESNVKKILNDFREKRALYEEFCLAMYKLLDSMLVADGCKYQIFYRIKELDNLEEKIKRKETEGVIYEKLEDLEDLAGLRILFYIEEDKNKFEKKLLSELSGEVGVTHYKKMSGYESTHVIAKFGEKRIRLSEYNKFDGLKCEIQLTSILHHAWSEIEHDIIYKDTLGVKSDKQQRVYIKKVMQKILTKYLIKASTELNNLIKKIKK